MDLEDQFNNDPEQDSTSLITTDDYSVYTVRPIWEPFNSAAGEIVDRLMISLCLPSTPGRRPKYRCMVSSVLQAAQYTLKHPERGQNPENLMGRPLYLGAPVGNDNWSTYPLVGREVARKVLAAFVERGFLSKVDDSGQRNFYKTLSGRTAYLPIMTMWKVGEALYEDLSFSHARFVDSGRPRVLVNIAETKAEKRTRERLGGRRERLSNARCIDRFGDQYRYQIARVEALSAYWQRHPLVFPDGTAAASATRIFTDGRMDVSGRLYGRWTNRPASQRFECTIDGKPLVSLDITASQPTLLSALLGVKLRQISDTESWYDPYTQLTGLWDHGLSTNMSYSELDTQMKRSRTIAKRVVMEMIGTGNPSKQKPSNDLVKETQVTQDEWDFYQEKLIDAIPALEKLEPRYDSNGNLAGYINGPAFLAYHESEIMMRTLEKLRESWDVPAYPVHDCLLVKEDDQNIGYIAFTDTISDYCQALSGVPLTVPISIEQKDGTKRVVRGSYDRTLNNLLTY
jgi:hypothetical protein